MEEDPKTALREKNRMSAKQFMKKRKAQLKQQKTHLEAFEVIRDALNLGNTEKFNELLNAAQPQLAFNFLFSDNQLKETPIIECIRSQSRLNLLSSINKWAANNSELLIRQLYMEGNQLRNNDFNGKFHYIHRCILDILDGKISKKEKIEAEITVIGEKDGIFYHLSKNYLNIESIKLLISNIKSKNELITQLYMPLLTTTPLQELQELSVQIKTYQLILLRQKLWKNIDYSVIETDEQSANILNLKYLGYNVWHQLAQTKPEEFLKACRAIIANQVEINHVFVDMLREIDQSGQSPVDKCLRKWKYLHIKQLFGIGEKIQSLHLTTNCLNLILSNSKLSKQQKQEFILLSFNSELASKGYVKAIPIQNEKQIAYNGQKGKKINVKSSEYLYTFSICFDSQQITTKLDNSRLFPLVTYLKSFKDKCDLKILQLLFFSSLNKKEIKKKVQLLMKTSQHGRIKQQKYASRLQQINFLFDYYQPLWMTATSVPHGDVLYHLLNKLYLNVCEIKQGLGDVKIDLLGTHFLAYYLSNTSFLGKDNINDYVYETIINSKDTEQNVGPYRMANKLIESLNPLQKIHSNEYLPNLLKSYLKAHICKLTISQISSPLTQAQATCLFDILTKPLQQKKKALLTSQQIFQMYPIDKYIPQHQIQTQQKRYQNFDTSYKRLLIKLGKIKESKQYVDWRTKVNNYSNEPPIAHLQNFYSINFKPEDRNEQFFMGLKAHLEGLSGIRQSQSSIKFKYYSFRLRPKEKYLKFKITNLLQLGIDPYFSRFTDKSYVIEEEDKVWKSIMNRMIQKRCTFINALICERDAQFSDFKEIFEENIKYREEWISLSLLKKIQMFATPRTAIDSWKKFNSVFKRAQNNFLGMYQQPFNFTFIKDVFLYFYENQKIQSIGEIYQKYFIVTLNELLNQLQKLDVKQQIAVRNSKRKQILSFASQNLTYLAQLSKTEAKSQSKFQQFVCKLYEKGCYAKQDVLLQALRCVGHDYFSMQDFYSNKKLFYLCHDDMLKQLAPVLEHQQKLDLIPVFYARERRHAFVQFIGRFSENRRRELLKKILEAEASIIEKAKQSQVDLYSHVQYFAQKIIDSFSDDLTVKLLTQNIDITLSQWLKKRSLRSTTNAQLIFLRIFIYNDWNASFYFKDEEKYVKFHSKTIFFQCSDTLFNQYFEYLQKHHKHIKNIESHFYDVLNCLAEGQSWNRILKLIKFTEYQNYYIKIFFKIAKNLSNKKVKKESTQFRQIYEYFLNCMTKNPFEFQQNIFISIFQLQFSSAFQLMTPVKLSLQNIKRCLSQSPQSSSLFLKANPIITNSSLELFVKFHILKNSPEMLQEQRVAHIVKDLILRMFPAVPHYYYHLPEKRYLLDELQYEFSILKPILSPVKAERIQTLKALATSQLLLSQKKSILNGYISDEEVVRMILSSVSTGTLKKYREYIHDFDSLTKKILSASKSKKGACANLSHMQQALIKELINEDLLPSTDQKEILSTFLRIFDTANMSILELFIKHHKIVITLEFLQSISLQFPFSFWQHLLSHCNQNYIIQFITKFCLFDLYRLEEYSTLLLNQICRFRWNKVMEFIINYHQTKNQSSPIFVAQTIEEKPQISSKGVFYLPLALSIENNYYQTYFLIRSSGNECEKFNISQRFISTEDPQAYSFIPQLKRRVKINNLFIESLKQAQKMQFRRSVLMPSLLDLSSNGSSKYQNQLAKFLLSMINKTLQLHPFVGMFEKLCMLVVKEKEIKIPVQELQKRYSSEMTLIIKFKNFFEEIQVNVGLKDLFDCTPELKPLLFIYNIQLYIQLQSQFKISKIYDNDRLDYSLYMRGIQVNFLELQSQHCSQLISFADQYFFTMSNPRLGDPKCGFSLTREALILLLIEISLHRRSWEKCPIFTFCKNRIHSLKSPQQILYELSLCLNYRPKQAITFDLMIWNKIFEEIEEISSLRKRVGKEDFEQFTLPEQLQQQMLRKYSQFITTPSQKFALSNARQILKKLLVQQLNNCSTQAIFVELSLIINTILLKNDISQLCQQLESIKGSQNIAKYSITLAENAEGTSSKISESELSLNFSYSFSRHQKKYITMVVLNSEILIEKIKYELALMSVTTDPKIEFLNDFCRSPARSSCFINYNFEYEGRSFHSIKNYETLENIFDHGRMKSDGAIGKIVSEVEKLEEKLLGTRNLKIYSYSDTFGPINFSEEIQSSKIMDCLAFYELITFPKQSPVKLIFTDKSSSNAEKNQAILSQIKQYMAFCLKTAKDEEADSPKINTEIYIRVESLKGEEKVMLDWWNFGIWGICELYCLILHYSGDLSIKIEKLLDVRVSFASVISYYEEYLKVGGEENIKVALEKLLFSNDFNRLVECIVIMIAEDVSNIMKIVKGIIIKLDVNNKKNKRSARVRVSEFANLISVDYQVKDELLNIKINIQMDRNQEQNLPSDNFTVLVNRKDFLDSVFTSAQFLTDYFLIRHELNNECVNISTSLSKKLNSTINFHIEYSNLYKFIDRIRGQKSIKDLEMYLKRLKHYLHGSIDKSINAFLNSAELANRHQIFILNKCEAINRRRSIAQISEAKQLKYSSVQGEPQSGLSEVCSLMKEIGNSEKIKNVFLIQVYKSYFTTMVAEGMTFVVGYKSNKRKPQVIEITKAENVNQINIIEVDFIMLVSQSIPSNDELNQSKIIRILITDSNKNLYKLNGQVTQYFMDLPQESEERNMGSFAPLVSSNIKLNFIENGAAPNLEKDTKIFYILLDESVKFKISPMEEESLSPLNICKRDSQFKEAILELQKGFRAFCQESFEIIVDLPEKFTQEYRNIHFAHSIHLVSMDILQFLSKFEFQPMRNATLDCKLSIEKGFEVNKNTVIELRKRIFLRLFKRLRIRVRASRNEITFEKGEIILNIDGSFNSPLPSSSDYLSSIVDQILNEQKRNLPKCVSFAPSDKDQSSQILLKELDLLNCLPYQIEEIKIAQELISLFFNKKIQNYQITIHRRKSEIRVHGETLEILLNIQTIERQFYGAEQLVRAFVLSANKHFQANVKGRTLFDPINRQIALEQSIGSSLVLAYQDKGHQWKMVNIQQSELKEKMILELKDYNQSQRYYIVESNNIYSNYFFQVDQKLALKEKSDRMFRKESRHLYLESQQAINLNFTNITVTQTHPLYKENVNTFNILRNASDKNKTKIKLLSKNHYNIIIDYEQSLLLSINYGGSKNIFSPTIQSSRVMISSNGEICLSNTKFVQLEPYKKKPVVLKSEENVNEDHQFRESNEFVSEEQLQLNTKESNNIENLVYVVNDECKKFLTRAGEPRVDYIQICDRDGNPIDYREKLDVVLVHINKLAIIRPEIIVKDLQRGLRWVPTIRGHYYIYINKVRLNPPYEIGVCAAQADYKTTIVTLPKINKICYCEDSEIMLELKDAFSNIYTQLEEQIIGDSLIIQMRSSSFGDSLKIQKSQINKYGLKKIKFNFNDNKQSEARQIIIEVSLNCQFLTQFSIVLQGLSLKQRKKLLDGDISKNNKNYYKDIQVNRNRFLEDLFTIAQRSVHTNFSVKYTNEPGIDAGGVKREFYDMIGNEMKNERNPFFKLVNPTTMEYFFNPDLLRNKKKLEYMELFGKYLANSFLNNYLLGISFSTTFVKMLYEQETNFEDLLAVLTPEERRQYEYLLKATPEEFQDLDLYFTAMVDKKKCIQIQLKENGKQIQVTASNVSQYLQLISQTLLTDRYQELIKAFRKGFQTVLDLEIFKKRIRYNQFWCLTAGNKEITPELILNYIVFQGNNIENVSGWFRRFITEANTEVLTGFLKFSSGSSSIDFNLVSKITVNFENAGQNPKKLPISHTCWKEIVVPKYKNYEIMKKLLTAAFIYCSEGFGFG